MSARQRIYLFGEGNDDVRLLRQIISPELKRKYADVLVVQYAQTSKRDFANLFMGIRRQNADYLVFADLDENPCVTSRKKKLASKWGRRAKIDLEKVVIVVKEIEGWYLAGVDEKTQKALRIVLPKNMNTLTKENFDSVRPRKFDSRPDYMSELLNHFSIETAKKKNKSFKYFMKKHKIPAG